MDRRGLLDPRKYSVLVRHTAYATLRPVIHIVESPELTPYCLITLHPEGTRIGLEIRARGF